MDNGKITARPAWKRVALPLALAGALLAATACGHLAMMGQAPQRPAAEAFGLGPRLSVNKVYTATLQPREPLRQPSGDCWKASAGTFPSRRNVPSVGQGVSQGRDIATGQPVPQTGQYLSHRRDARSVSCLYVFRVLPPLPHP